MSFNRSYLAARPVHFNLTRLAGLAGNMNLRDCDSFGMLQAGCCRDQGHAVSFDYIRMGGALFQTTLAAAM